MPRAVFPGSFDPFTLGHLDLLKRAVALFGDVLVAVGANPAKQGLFTPQERERQIRAVVAAHRLPAEVAVFEGLLVHFCRARGCLVVVRGIRSATDLGYEAAMAATNRTQVPGLETVFLPAAPEWGFLSATLVREIARGGGDVRPLVPEPVAADVARRQQETAPR